MKHLTHIIIISFALLSCHQNDLPEIKDPIEKPEPLTEIDNAISRMCSDTVEGKIIGSCWARESKIYAQFEHINSLSSDNDLIALTNHSKANIRAYAFWFLAKRKSPKIKEVYKTMLNDTGEITLRYKSEQWIYKVSDFCEFVLRPNDFDNSTCKYSAEELQM